MHYTLKWNWSNYVQSIDTNRLLKQALQYKSKVAATCTGEGHKETTKKKDKIQTEIG